MLPASPAGQIEVLPTALESMLAIRADFPSAEITTSSRRTADWLRTSTPAPPQALLRIASPRMKRNNTIWSGRALYNLTMMPDNSVLDT